MRLIDADDAIRKMESVMDMQELYLPIHFKEWVIDECHTIDAVPRQKYEEDMENAFSHGYTDAESKYRKMIADGELVEVVRCRDCKHYVYGKDEAQYYCRQTGIGTEDDFYCAYGERRTDGR